ncbi:hypothetical protein [Sinorhizobium sp. 22678]|uniref:hypothetical protein n=1 Tax=Sinorhizobium sp. 22678 TaxID=3453955 RepID=UPI003F866F1F
MITPIVPRVLDTEESAMPPNSSYIEERSDKNVEFFDFDYHHFFADKPIDAGLRDAFIKRLWEHVCTREPFDVLTFFGRWAIAEGGRCGPTSVRNVVD